MSQIKTKDLLSLSLPEREYYCGNWLTKGSLGMIWGWRGTGKSMIAMSLVHAIGSGVGYLNWRETQPARCLYLDYEMGLKTLQERLLQLSRSYTIPDNLDLLSCDQFANGRLPALSDPKWQGWYSSLLESYDIVVIDNLAFAVRPMLRESPGQDWLRVQDWAVAQRSKGKTIIFINHAGKSGDQRGSSQQEDVLDYSIALKGVPWKSLNKQISFEFIKARHDIGVDQDRLVVEFTGGRDSLSFIAHRYEDLLAAKVLEMAKYKISAREIAAFLNTPIDAITQIIALDKSATSPKDSKELDWDF